MTAVNLLQTKRVFLQDFFNKNFILAPKRLQVILRFDLISADHQKRIDIETVKMRLQINSDPIVRQNMVGEVAVGGLPAMLCSSASVKRKNVMSLHLLIIFFLFIFFQVARQSQPAKRKWPNGNTGFGSPFFYYSNHVSTLLYFDNNRRPVSFVPLLSKNGTKVFLKLFFKDFWVYLSLLWLQSRYFYQLRYPARKLFPVQDNEMLLRLINPDWKTKRGGVWDK